jgi:hypothetical protein
MRQVITEADKAAAVDFIVKKTKGALLARPKGKKASKKASDIASILDRGEFGCQSRKIRAIFSEVIGEQIPSPELSLEEMAAIIKSNEGAAFVVTEKSRFEGTTCIIAPGTCAALLISSFPGVLHNIGSMWRNDDYASKVSGISHIVRKATAEEIKNFVNSVSTVDDAEYSNFRKLITGV